MTYEDNVTTCSHQNRRYDDEKQLYNERSLLIDILGGDDPRAEAYQFDCGETV